MVVSIVFLVLLFAIAVLQSGQGLFNALIMVVLTLCCAAAALGTHEWAANQLAGYWKPDFAHPIALGATFGIPLLVLRIIFDRVIRRDCVVPVMIGRVGGGICGLVTALVISGMAALCLQMLPMGTSILGFSRFATLTRDAKGATPPPTFGSESGIWLSPDRFAAAIGNLLVDGVFSGGSSFAKAYPDFVQSTGWVSTVPTSMSRYSKPNGISIVRTEELPFLYRFSPADEQRRTAAEFEAIPPEAGESYRMVRVQLKSEARDPKKSHFFTLRQFRLVGTLGADGPLQQFYPMAIQQAEADPTVNRHIRYIKDGRGDWPVVNELYAPREDNNDQVEIVFVLPTGFVPHFMEYKRGSRTAVSFSDDSAGSGESNGRRGSGSPGGSNESASAGSEGSGTPAGADSSGDSGRRRRSSSGDSTDGRGGRVRRFATLEGGSTFTDQLPMDLKSYRGLRNLETGGDAVRSGHLSAEVEQQSSGTDPPLARFDVPANQRLLHLNVSSLGARSGLGRAVSFAVGVAQNYLVEDSQGHQYKIAGKYALARVNGVETLEIQYFPDQAGSIGGLGAFSNIKDDDLKAGDQLVLLFLVDPGAELAYFSTGDASRKEDIRSQGLVAPN